MHEIELKPSRLLGLLLLGLVALSLLAIGMAALPGWAQWGLVCAVAGSVVWVLRQSRHTEALRLTAAGQLQTLDDEGEWRDADVLGDSLVSPQVIVLRYRLPGGRVRTLTLLSDSASADDLRRLRVSLRWASHTRSDTSSRDAG